jgi:hypothetical protein
MANGTIQPDLSDEDRRAGFDFDSDGNLTKDGFPADISELPSRQFSSNLGPSSNNGFTEVGPTDTDSSGNPAPSFQGTTGTVQVGHTKDRYYGINGYPKTDVDWDTPHPGVSQPHAHDWEGNDRGRPRDATPEEVEWSRDRRDPDTGVLE